MTLDIKIFYFFNNFAGKYRIIDALIIFFANYLQYLLIIFFLLFLLFSFYSKRKKIRIFFVTIISSIVARLGATEIIRFFYHRPRPFLIYNVHQLISENRPSFPSGHATFFFAMATAIYFYNKKWGVGFFIASIVMNVSRIMAGVHYPSDVIAGMIIGIIIAWFTFYLVERKESSNIN